MLAGFCFAFIFGQTPLLATTNVPKGGAVIDVGAGGNNIQIEIKNNTGKEATDVTVTIYKDDNSAVPNIVTLDIVGKTDNVDDNGDGINNPGETDNTDSSPGTTGRTMMSGTGNNKVKNGETATVNIGLSGSTPAGTKIRVRFSTKDNANRHFDMCASLQMRGLGNSHNVGIPIGTSLAQIDAWNVTVNDVTSFSLQVPMTSGLVFNSISIAPPYTGIVNIVSNTATVTVNPPIMPFEAMSMFIVFNMPYPLAMSTFVSTTVTGQLPHPSCMSPEITGVNSFAIGSFFDIFTTVSFDDSPRHCQDFTVTNTTGQAASDLHITFAGTGGSLETAVIAAPGCGQAQIPSNGKVTNTAEIIWPSACVPAGGTVTIRVCTMNGPLAFAGGHWTNNNNNIGAVNPADIADTGNNQGVPGNSYTLLAGDNFTTFFPDGSGLQTVALTNAFLPPIPYDVMIANSGDPTCNNTMPGLLPAITVPCSSMVGTAWPMGDYPRIVAGINDPVSFIDGGNPVTGIKVTPPVMIDPINNFICGTDYRASFVPNGISVVFSGQAPFAVEVSHMNGTIVNYIIEVGVNCTDAGDTGGECNGGSATEIDCGIPDVAVVSGTLGFPHAWGDIGEEVGNINEAIEAINAAYAANGNQPVEVTIDAHGSSGSIEIGGETFTIDNVADFAAAVAGKISALNIFGCSVAEGPEGLALICALEIALGCNVVASTGVMSDTGDDPNRWFTEGEMISWEPPTIPIIDFIYPFMAYPGETIQIHGSGFGSPSPESQLFIGSFFDVFVGDEYYSLWTDNLIIFTMPCSPAPPNPDLLPAPIQVILENGGTSNFMDILYHSPQRAFITNPKAERETVIQQIFWIYATPQGSGQNYEKAEFFYRDTPSSPWNFIGTDLDGSSPGIGTLLPMGTGDGWSFPWEPPVLPTQGTWKEIKVVFTDFCGNEIEDIKPIFCDPTPLKPLIDYNFSKLYGNRGLAEDNINLNFEILDENANLLTITWWPLFFEWLRVLEPMGQLDSGIEDKEGDDASSMACGPVAAASCLRYFKDRFPAINDANIDSLAKLIACHSDLDDETGTKVGGLIKGMGETLKGLGIDIDGWTAEWHSSEGNEKNIMADMIKCMTVDSADVIPLFYQKVNCDMNEDGVVDEKDYAGHYVTLSSKHSGVRDEILPPIPPGQHIMVPTLHIDFMDPWTGNTQIFEVDNTTTPPELKGKLSCYTGDTCYIGNSYLRGYIKIKPPAAGGGGGGNIVQRTSGNNTLNNAAAMMTTQTVPLSGPGTYNINLPSTMFEVGGSLMTLTTSDSDGNEQSSNLLVYVGGCNSADFYHYQTSSPLTVQFNDITQYDPNHPPTEWEWDFNDDEVIDATTQSPQFTFPASGNYIVRMMVTAGGCTDAVAYTVAVSSTVPQRVHARALLEGPYNGGGMMTTTLLAENLIPETHPFKGAPWFYNGNEGVTNLPANITDWVLIELRNNATPGIVAASRAGFLRNDGVILELDGTPGLYFPGVSNVQNFHIVVRHRNHLAVISSGTVMTNNSVSPYNFTSSAAQVQGTNQMNPVSGGFFALSAGDFNSDGVVTVFDFNFYQSEASLINQYLTSDCNLDKTVSVADFNLYMPNSSKIGVSLIRY